MTASGVLGIKILTTSPSFTPKNFKDLAPVARGHHESFDGSGYPDGLKGEEIPFMASLVKVADVYDALTQRRQYKEGYKQSEAIEKMIEEVKKGRMSAKIMTYLMQTLLEEVEDRVLTHEKNVKEYKDNLEVLHELEKIYKNIYDRGYTNKAKKALAKYDLQAGYDMSTNANLLITKQRALEKEKEWLNFCEDEYKKMKKQAVEIESLAKKEKWYANEYKK